MKENKRIQQILQWLGGLNRFARLGILMAIVLPVLTSEIISFIRAKQELGKHAFDRRLVISQLTAATLSQKLDQLKATAAYLAEDVRFGELLSEGLWPEGAKTMANIAKYYPSIDRGAIVDLKGNVLTIWPAYPEIIGKNFKHSDWYRGVTKDWKPYVSNVFKSAAEPHNNVIAVAVPLKNEKQHIVGILVLQIIADQFFDWINNIEIGPSGSIYFVDSSGSVVFHPRDSSQGDILNYSSVPVVKKVLQGKEGVEVNFNPVVNEERLSAYSPVAGYGWGVIFQEPTTTAFAFQASRLKRRLFESFIIFAFTCMLAFVILSTVSRLSEANTQLSEAGLFSDLLIDNVPDMIFVKDARDLKFVRLNKAGEELLGYSQSEMIGKSDYDFFPKSEAEYFIAKDRSILSSGKSLDIPEETIHTRFKGVRILNTRKVPLNSKYLIGISEDVTDKIGLIEARLAQQAAEDLAKRKATFLDIAAHELRTPITVISMMLQIAEKQSTKGRPITIDVLARIQAPVKRLTRLIVDLLEMSRLDRGLLVLVPVQTDLVSLVSTSIEEFRLLAPERSFLFNKSIQPIELSIDPARINQVLSNLLDNAVKYTSEDVIEITIEIMPNVIRVSVRDHGPGIPKEQQAGLFHAFSRGSSDTVIRASGLGLGLSICHGIISLHGGVIGFVSEEGKGTTFYFELPKTEIKT